LKLDQLRVGLIGAGAIARDRHIPGWRLVPQAQIVCVADASLAAAESAARDFQIERFETDYRRLLDDPSIDVVDLCLPSALHAQVSISALAAGKHVLCEKPMATCRADAEAVLAAAHVAGKKLMIGQQMRFEPSIVLIRKTLESIDLGHVYYARAQWLRRRRVPGRPGFTFKAYSGGGPMYDVGVHVLDLAWWLMGCPEPLAASGATFNHLIKRDDLGTEWGTWDPKSTDVEDFAAGMVRFAGGGVLFLEASWLGFQPEREMRRLQLYGTRAGLTWPDCRIFGETAGKPWDLQLPYHKGDKPHFDVIAQFAKAVLEDEPVPVPPEQSVQTIAMLEALYQSAAEGCEVHIPPIGSQTVLRMAEPPQTVARSA
jgi:predicted dehydrogenase